MTKPSLLLIDKDPKSRRVLEVSLRKAGYQVTLAQSGIEAWDVFCQTPPDLVVSDLFQENIDGLALFEKAKENSFASVPFLFLARTDQVDSQKQAIEIGAAELINRPFYVKELVARVKLLLQRANRARLKNPSETTSFSGSLSDLGVVDLLQTLEQGRKTGIITLEKDARKGEIFLRNGRVVDAVVGRLNGEDAIFRMFLWTQGTYTGEFRNVRCEEKITLSSQGLILEGMRRLEEWTRLLDGLPPVHHTCEVDYSTLAERLGDLPDEVNAVLRLFDGHRSLLQVIDDAEFGPIETLTILGKLYAEGILYDTVQRPSRLKGLIPSPELERWLAGIPALPAEISPNGLAAPKTQKALPDLSQEEISSPPQDPPKEAIEDAPKEETPSETIEETIKDDSLAKEVQEKLKITPFQEKVEKSQDQDDDSLLPESDIPPPMHASEGDAKTLSVPVEQLVEPSTEELPDIPEETPPPGAIDTLIRKIPVDPDNKVQEIASFFDTHQKTTSEITNPANGVDNSLSSLAKETPSDTHNSPFLEKEDEENELPTEEELEPPTQEDLAPPLIMTSLTKKTNDLKQEYDDEEYDETLYDEDLLDDDSEEDNNYLLPTNSTRNPYINYAIFGIGTVLVSSLIYIAFFSGNSTQENKTPRVAPIGASTQSSPLPDLPETDLALVTPPEDLPETLAAETLPAVPRIVSEEDKIQYDEHVQTASSHYVERQYAKALGAYKNALMFDEQGKEALTGIGAVLYDQGAVLYEESKFAESRELLKRSIEQLSQVVEQYPEYVTAHLSLCLAYDYRARKGEISPDPEVDSYQAIKHCEISLKLSPEGPIAETAKEVIADLSKE